MDSDKFAVELLDDFLKTRGHWAGRDAQFWRRAGVRALFGSLEAWCSFMRSSSCVLIAKRKEAGLLPAGEEERARELVLATDRHEVTVNEQGLPIKRHRKVSFRPRLRAVIRLNCLAWGLSSTYADRHFGEASWQALSAAIKIRDRITHPHEPADINVSDADLDQVCQAWDWFADLFKDIETATSEAMAKLVAELERGNHCDSANG
jgi:hypothetical protein